MKRVLIVGASGFIARTLQPFLQACGYVVDTLSHSRGDWAPERDYLPEMKVAGYDAIVNLAGHSIFGLWTKGQKEKIRNSRTHSTRLLVETINKLDLPPEVFISASATGYYGSCIDEELYEEHMPGKGFLADVCCQWEHEALELQNTRTTILRLGMVLSPEGGALKILRPLFSLALGGRLGSGCQWMSWIGMQDLLQLIGFIIETPALSGAINATSPHPVTNREFTQTLAKKLHRPACFHVPAAMLHLLPGGFADEVLLCSARALPKKALQAGFTFSQPNLIDAL